MAEYMDELNRALGNNFLMNSGGIGLDPRVGDSSLSKLDKFGLGIGAVDVLANIASGLQQYKLGKQSLATNRNAFNRNLANQAQVTNAAIYDDVRRKYYERTPASQRGNMDAINAAIDAEYNRRKVSGAPI